MPLPRLYLSISIFIIRLPLRFLLFVFSSSVQIKKGIKDIRGNVAEQLWKITKEVEVLIRENWTDKALRELKVPIRNATRHDTTTRN